MLRYTRDTKVQALKQRESLPIKPPSFLNKSARAAWKKRETKKKKKKKIPKERNERGNLEMRVAGGKAAACRRTLESTKNPRNRSFCLAEDRDCACVSSPRTCVLHLLPPPRVFLRTHVDARAIACAHSREVLITLVSIWNRKFDAVPSRCISSVTKSVVLVINTNYNHNYKIANSLLWGWFVHGGFFAVIFAILFDIYIQFE